MYNEEFGMIHKLKNTFGLLKNIRTMSQGSTPLIVVEKLDAVTTIGINRPEKRNCVNSETSQLLKEQLEKFENDEESLVGVLYGIGGNFCAGYDLAEVAGTDKATLATCFGNTGAMGPTDRFIKKPLIAAVSGYAVAGGFELALMCDLRVVEDNAVMGVYCRRFGVPLLDGGTIRLTAMVGLSRALDLILTGRSLPAKEAFECGIANRIVACGTSLGQAINLALSLTKFPQACMLADRASTYNSAFNSSFDKLWNYERQNGTSALNEETVEGAKKFLSGIGRHGTSYNLKEKELLPWEIDYEASTKHKL